MEEPGSWSRKASWLRGGALHSASACQRRAQSAPWHRGQERNAAGAAVTVLVGGASTNACGRCGRRREAPQSACATRRTSKRATHPSSLHFIVCRRHKPRTIRAVTLFAASTLTLPWRNSQRTASAPTNMPRTLVALAALAALAAAQPPVGYVALPNAVCSTSGDGSVRRLGCAAL
jgi:hypothetical protein